jgi:mono/diheme cytochrome c family protein
MMYRAMRHCPLVPALALAVFAAGGESSIPAGDPDAIAQDRSSQRVAPAPGPGQNAVAPRVSGASLPSNPAIPAAAIQVYRASCIPCHDVDGRGEVDRESLPSIPDFTDGKWQSSRSDAQLSRSILDGKGKSMPRMKNKLGSVDVNLMVALVRAFRDGKLVVEDEPDVPSALTDPAANASPDGSAKRSSSVGLSSKDQSAQQGRRLFERSCARCHDRDGKGATARESLPTIPDFTVRRWQQSRKNAQLLVSILDGKGTGMPAFRDKVPREQARDVVAYIRTFAPDAAAVTASSTDEFDSQFNMLTREIDELARRIRTLSSPATANPTNPVQPDSAAKKK